MEQSLKRKKDEYPTSRLTKYKKFLKETSDQLKSKLETYERNIEKILSTSSCDYVKAFEEAVARYAEIRNMKNIDFGELLKNESDKMMGRSSMIDVQNKSGGSGGAPELKESRGSLGMKQSRFASMKERPGEQDMPLESENRNLVAEDGDGEDQGGDELGGAGTGIKNADNQKNMLFDSIQPK